MYCYEVVKLLLFSSLSFKYIVFLQKQSVSTPTFILSEFLVNHNNRYTYYTQLHPRQTSQSFVRMQVLHYLKILDFYADEFFITKF